jgi:hypothetical protein
MWQFEKQNVPPKLFVLTSACAVERTYKDRAVAASCYRTFQLAITEYSTATADHRAAMKPSRTDSASMGRGPRRFSPHFDGFFFCFGLLFGMSSEHKKWQFERAGVRKLSAKLFSSPTRIMGLGLIWSRPEDSFDFSFYSLEDLVLWYSLELEQSVWTVCFLAEGVINVLPKSPPLWQIKFPNIYL